MSELRFKVGDRVIGKEGAPYIGGKVGTIVTMRHYYGYGYGVQFDKPLGEYGHDIGGKGKEGHCRWANDGELEPVPVPYFVDARVGDSVYDMVGGEGMIEGIELNRLFSLKVRFDGDEATHNYFTLEGRTNIGLNQTLFYSKPVFNLPPPPKRKVKKVIEGWENIYPISDDSGSHIGLLGLCGNLYPTEDLANNQAGLNRLGKAHFVRHEYEE